mgnify:CR=1 FL=1
MNLKLLTGAIVSSAFLLPGSASGQTADFNIVPQPLQVDVTNDAPFILNGKTSIVVASKSNDMKRNATLLASYIEQTTGVRPVVGKQAKNAATIVLTIDKSIDNAEGYKLDIDAKSVRIAGATAAGVFYGIQTLRKSLPVVSGKASQVTVPCAHIVDAPRFSYRGTHLDVSRHFVSTDEIRQFIDILALHNINRFHWHLTDDQGWRIEIKKYPLLTKIGSKRTQTVIGHNTGKYDGKPYGGFYTQKEIRDIVKYAADRYITIVPEIDLPGHMQAALAAYPELGCTGGPYKVWEMWGVSDNVLCAGNDKTMKFVDDVLKEVVALFPSKYIHVGGDECPKERWKECERCQAKIAELGLKDIEGHSKEEQLQTWFMDEVAKQIRARGRKMIGWDEILEGTPSKDVTVIGWTSPKATVRAAKAGHPTVIAPIQHFYFSNVGLNKITGIPSIERVYNLEPYQDGLTPAEQQNVIGAEGCIWTEWVKDAKKMEWELLPRLAALCEVQWTQKEQRNLDSFLQRMLHIHDIYRLKNLNYKEDIEAAVKK